MNFLFQQLRKNLILQKEGYFLPNNKKLLNKCFFNAIDKHNIKLNGFLLLNKPKNISSYNCVHQIKTAIKKQNLKIKVGHSGTLDVFANGLLIICIGNDATKQVGGLLDLDKEYIVKAKLGQLTDTQDLTGKDISANFNFKQNINRIDIEDAIKAIGSSYKQVPPIYSALKYKGKPLYEYARKQLLSDQQLEQIVQEKAKQVSIYKLQLINYEYPFFSFISQVSKGTYIRSLADDIATKAGSRATTYELTRTKIGKFSLENAVNLEQLLTLQDIQKHMLNQLL